MIKLSPATCWFNLSDNLQKVITTVKIRPRADTTPKVSEGDRGAQGMLHVEKLQRIMGTWMSQLKRPSSLSNHWYDHVYFYS